MQDAKNNVDDVSSIFEVFGDKKLVESVSRALASGSIPLAGNGKSKGTSPIYRIKNSRNKLKKLNLLGIDTNVCYVDFIPLHDLWRQYVSRILKLSDTSTNTFKIGGVDWHGSVLKVVRSTCPSSVNINGIVLQETENTIRLITQSNDVKTIPKKGHVFAVDIEGKQFCVFGDHMLQRPSMRSKMKLKPKPHV